MEPLESILQSLNLFDYAVLLLGLVALVRGAIRGLTGELAGLVTWIVATGIAWYYKEPIAVLLAEHTRFEETPVTAGFAFFLLFLAGAIVVGTLMRLIHKLVEWSFLGTLNRLGGVLAGGIKALLLLCLFLILVIYVKEPALQQVVLKDSRTGSFLMKYLPDAYTALSEEFPSLPALDFETEPDTPAEADSGA